MKRNERKLVSSEGTSGEDMKGEKLRLIGETPERSSRLPSSSGGDGIRSLSGSVSRTSSEGRPHLFSEQTSGSFM